MYIYADFARSVEHVGSYKNRNAQLYDIVRLAVHSGYCNNLVVGCAGNNGPTMAVTGHHGPRDAFRAGLYI